MNSLSQIVEHYFEHRQQYSPENAPLELKSALSEILEQLNGGHCRVAELHEGQWRVHEWLKKAILMYFKITPNQLMHSGDLHFYDKVPLKFQSYGEAEWLQQKTRVVPPACVRWGAYVGPNVILMPSYVNMGAYIDEGTLIDTWATVGSCAQIGKNVHISGGTGIGGVLEPLQAHPTIIEDGCFIGARSEIAEGVIVEKNSVISMGVFIGQSTKIYNRETKTITYGRVPAGSVVIPGMLPSADGTHSLSCAVIVKQVDEKTRSKTSINELLREVTSS